MQHLLFFLMTQEMVQVTRMRRRGLSASQKRELWERWKRGQSLNDIARALGKKRGSIHFALACDGGIQPDILISRDTLTDGEQHFFQVLGQQLPDYRNVLTHYALELKGQEAVASPDFEVTSGMLSTILQSMRAADIEMPDSTFEGGSAFVAAQFGLELTRYAFGRESELRRSAVTDNQIAKAIELLQKAKSPEELLALARIN